MQAVKAWAAFCAIAYIVFKAAILSGSQSIELGNIGTFVDLLGAVAILLGLVVVGDWIRRHLSKPRKFREAPLDGATMPKNENPWWHDGRKLLAAVIAAVVLLAAWMFRFEQIGQSFSHRNRFTGATCPYWEECWFRNK